MHISSFVDKPPYIENHSKLIDVPSRDNTYKYWFFTIDCPISALDGDLIARHYDSFVVEASKVLKVEIIIVFLDQIRQFFCPSEMSDAKLSHCHNKQK